MAHTPLWNNIEVAQAVSPLHTVRRTWEASGVAIRSADVKPGDLFVALKGELRDGHDFLHEAAARGASAALVSRNPLGPVVQIPLVHVEDTKIALNRLGSAGRNRVSARIAAVTGSAGKTTTKEMLRWMLSGSAKTYATEGNLNNEYGVPLSLARMPSDVEYGVFELGMSEAGEIKQHSKLVRPHVAVITNVAAAHLEFFSSVDAIADAKAEIFEGLAPDGAAVVNRDSPYFDRIVSAAKRAGASQVRCFGRHTESDARLLGWTAQGTSMEVRAAIFDRTLAFVLGAVGEHMALNCVAGLLAVSELGADLEQCTASLREFHAVGGRGNVLKVARADGHFTIIDDSYNANPTSVRAAIRLLAETTEQIVGKRTLVLGDMLELGPGAASLHADLLEDLVAAKIDLVHCCGTLCKTLFDALPDSMRGFYAVDSAALGLKVCSSVQTGDVVVIKGSRGSKMELVVNKLRNSGHSAN